MFGYIVDFIVRKLDEWGAFGKHPKGYSNKPLTEEQQQAIMDTCQENNLCTVGCGGYDLMGIPTTVEFYPSDKTYSEINAALENNTEKCINCNRKDCPVQMGGEINIDMCSLEEMQEILNTGKTE